MGRLWQAEEHQHFTLNCIASSLVEQGTELLSVRSDGQSFSWAETNRIDFRAIVDAQGNLGGKLWDSGVLYPRIWTDRDGKFWLAQERTKQRPKGRAEGLAR